LYIDGEKATDLIETLQSYITLYGDSVRIEETQYEYDNGTYLGVFIDAPEDDMQYAKRVAQEVEYEQRVEAQERKQYEALKAKYG